MPIEIREVPATDLRQWMEAVETAGSSELTDQAWRDVQPIVSTARVLGAYDGATVVGGGGIFPYQLTVPGGRFVGAAGITAVGVIPTHRRQGILRRLMAGQLADARAHGEAVAILWASEGQIYQRFGYGLATLGAGIDLDRDRSAMRRDAPASGSVRLVDATEAAALFPPIFEVNRVVTPGFYARSEEWWRTEVLSDFEWNRRGAARKFYALHETDGQPDAYAIYRVKHDWPEKMPESDLLLQEIMAVDARALREMWRFVLGVDLIKSIKTRISAPNDPLLLMLAEPRRLRLRVRDGLWLRIVDVTAALEARGYAADGTVVFEIGDDFMPDAAGRFRLTAANGAGRVSRTSDPAEIALDIADLGAVYLGAFTLADLARADRTEELVPGARARADEMLASAVRPWCPQIF